MPGLSAETDAPKVVGRPRDEDIDGRVFAAALELIDAEADISVSGIVDRSGVSRAALYRRWPSLTKLIAAALDTDRSDFPDIDVDGDIQVAVFDAIFSGGGIVAATGYSEARFRRRVHLVMADRALQDEYWTSYVSRRREPVTRALQAGIERGILRSDVDVDAALDAFMGVFYYQFVARGARLDDPATRLRVRTALDVVWRGLLP